MLQIDNVVATWTAMEGVLLLPNPGAAVVMINIVAVSLLLASAQQRPLISETRICPISVKMGCFVDAHVVNKVPSTPAFGAPCSDHVVADCRMLADHRLACRKRANTVEWIRRKSIVVIDDVTVQP